MLVIRVSRSAAASALVVLIDSQVLSRSETMFTPTIMVTTFIGKMPRVEILCRLGGEFEEPSDKSDIDHSTDEVDPEPRDTHYSQDSRKNIVFLRV